MNTMIAPDKEIQATTSPDKILQLLREGNYRFANNLSTDRNLLQQVAQTRSAQYPLATVLNCIDSRTPTELIFDQGLGTLFGIRMAGSVISDEVLGSMEFSCKIAGSKLIVVLGHTKCGAIKGACDDVRLGHLTTLLDKIKPAVELENTVQENRTSKNDDFVNKVSQIHVRRSLAQVVERSTVLRAMVESSEIRLIGGIYDVDNGEVEFFEDDFASKRRRVGRSA